MSPKDSVDRRTVLKALGIAGVASAAGTGLSIAQQNGTQPNTDDSQSNTGSSQSNTNEPHKAWEKRYDLDVRFEDVLALDQGGYVVAGQTPMDSQASEGELDYKFWLAGVNETGEIEWSDTYGAGSPTTLVHADDGGVVIVGDVFRTVKDKNNDIAIARVVKTTPLDGDGAPSINWERSFEGNGSSNYYSSSLIDAVSVDDGVVGLGRTSEDDKVLWLVKLGFDGSVKWQRGLQPESYTDGYPYPADLFQTSDGGFVVVDSYDDFRLGVLKLDSEGKREWLTVGGSNKYWVGSQLDDGSFVVAGLGEDPGGFSVEKYDRDGSKAWEQTYEYAARFGDPHAVIPTDGGATVIGDVAGDNNGLWFLNIDDAGEKQWSYAFDPDEPNESLTGAIQVDGGYVIAANSKQDGDWIKPLLAKVSVPIEAGSGDSSGDGDQNGGGDNADGQNGDGKSTGGQGGGDTGGQSDGGGDTGGQKNSGTGTDERDDSEDGGC